MHLAQFLHKITSNLRKGLRNIVGRLGKPCTPFCAYNSVVVDEALIAKSSESGINRWQIDPQKSIGNFASSNTFGSIAHKQQNLMVNRIRSGHEVSVWVGVSEK